MAATAAEVDREADRRRAEFLALQRLDDAATRLQEEKKYMEALETMERGLVLRQHMFGPESEEVWAACSTVGELCNMLAMAALQKEDLALVLELLKKAEVLTERDAAGRAVTYNNLACYYRRRGKPHAALRFLQRALRIESRLPSCDNPHDTHLNLCAVLSQLGKHKEAMRHAVAALSILQERLFGSEGEGGGGGVGERPERVASLAIAYHNLGVEHEFLRQFDKAVGVYQRGLEVAQVYLGESHSIARTLAHSLSIAQKTERERIMKEQMRRGGAASAALQLQKEEEMRKERVRERRKKRKSKAGATGEGGGGRRGGRGGGEERGRGGGERVGKGRRREREEEDGYDDEEDAFEALEKHSDAPRDGGYDAVEHSPPPPPKEHVVEGGRPIARHGSRDAMGIGGTEEGRGMGAGVVVEEESSVMPGAGTIPLLDEEGAVGGGMGEEEEEEEEDWLELQVEEAEKEKERARGRQGEDFFADLDLEKGKEIQREGLITPRDVSEVGAGGDHDGERGEDGGDKGGFTVEGESDNPLPSQPSIPPSSSPPPSPTTSPSSPSKPPPGLAPPPSTSTADQKEKGEDEGGEEEEEEEERVEVPPPSGDDLKLTLDREDERGAGGDDKQASSSVASSPRSNPPAPPPSPPSSFMTLDVKQPKFD